MKAEGFRASFVHTRAYLYVTAVEANSAEETARLDAQRWRTKNMLRGTWRKQPGNIILFPISPREF